MRLRRAALVLSFGVVACGPQSREEAGDGVDAPPAFGTEVCDDGIDNDQDGKTDCSDAECKGVGDCPACEAPAPQALALPDGNDESGGACTSDATCGANKCVAGFCALPYTSQAIWSSFAQDATLTNPSQLQKVCLNIEHSWVADLQIELVAPNDAHLILHAYNRDQATGIFLGDANDNDDASAGVSPQPGVGKLYCFTPTASVPLWQGATTIAPDGFNEEITPGDYASAGPWTAIANAPLNGMWELRVTDLWADDNGFLFTWSMEFDPALDGGCADIIL
jgi:hypothetical protein